jgi:hypothetical protein
MTQLGKKPVNSRGKFDFDFKFLTFSLTFDELDEEKQNPKKVPRTFVKYL